MFRGHPSGRILVVAGSLLALAANLGILFSFPGLETSQVVSAWGGVGMLLLFAWVAAASAPWWPVSRVTPPSDPNLSEL